MTIAKKITILVEGTSRADLQKALETALDELAQGTWGGAGGTLHQAYILRTEDVAPSQLRGLEPALA
jgi:hypothetical protein